MITTTISDFRKDMKRYFNEVSQSLETLIIHRGKELSVVVMSLDEYNSLKATEHLLSSPANEKRLDSAVSRHQRGEAFEVELDIE